MSATISTPTNARKPDSASGYQYLVEKMRLAAEWRDVTFIPSYQQGDVVFYQGNMYIKKNVSANSLVNPASNTTDWISLENYIKEISKTDFGNVDYDNAGVNYKNYLNSLTDAEKINPKVFNAAVAAYMIMLDKGITRGGTYSFTTRTKTGGPANSYYEVQFYCESPYYIQAWAINNEYRGGGAPNDLSRPYFYTSNQGVPKSYTPVNAIDQLGYTPANVGGTNWNANAVATSLGYTPAKIGDSWISFRASYTLGQWYVLTPYTFSSSPDLGNFGIVLGGGQTTTDYFSFYLRKYGLQSVQIPTVDYNISVNARFINRIVSVNISSQSVIIGNLDKVIAFNTGGAIIWSAAIPTDVDIIIYFSKNL